MALRISRTVFSALSGIRLLACLIVAPHQGYDEPGFLSYAIRSFYPTSADGLHAGMLINCPSRVLMIGAWIFPGGDECRLVQMCSYLLMPIAGFGSSDCATCHSHLPTASGLFTSIQHKFELSGPRMAIVPALSSVKITP